MEERETEPKPENNAEPEPEPESECILGWVSLGEIPKTP